jgi:ABC-type sugar transport system ATPase subunit
VAENVFLGNYPSRDIGGKSLLVDWNQMNEVAQETISNRLKLEVDPTSRVELLSGGERQAVAIARALVSDPEVVILDEPTAELSEKVSEEVNKLIGTLQDQGHTIIVVDHNIENVLQVADRIAILHNGELVETVNADSVNKDEIVRMMISGEPSQKTINQ